LIIFIGLERFVQPGIVECFPVQDELVGGAAIFTADNLLSGPIGGLRGLALVTATFTGSENILARADIIGVVIIIIGAIVAPGLFLLFIAIEPRHNIPPILVDRKVY
jgi:hypothetical protein